ncbi:hypothetical protein Hanom_Chr07g00670011 [Helianthus anomalus]
MIDTQTIVDDDCIPISYDESPAKIRCLDRTCFTFSVCFYTRFCFFVVAGITVSLSLIALDHVNGYYTFFIERVIMLIKKLNKSGTHTELWGHKRHV